MMNKLCESVSSSGGGSDMILNMLNLFPAFTNKAMTRNANQFPYGACKTEKKMDIAMHCKHEMTIIFFPILSVRLSQNSS